VSSWRLLSAQNQIVLVLKRKRVHLMCTVLSGYRGREGQESSRVERGMNDEGEFVPILTGRCWVKEKREDQTGERDDWRLKGFLSSSSSFSFLFFFFFCVCVELE
jgi:hypothetical protein